MANPDDPKVQQECADRLIAYAARRRAALKLRSRARDGEPLSKAA